MSPQVALDAADPHLTKNFSRRSVISKKAHFRLCLRWCQSGSVNSTFWPLFRFQFTLPLLLRCTHQNIFGGLGPWLDNWEQQGCEGIFWNWNRVPFKKELSQPWRVTLTLRPSLRAGRSMKKGIIQTKKNRSKASEIQCVWQFWIFVKKHLFYYLILVLSFSIQVVVLQSTSNRVLFSEVVAAIVIESMKQWHVYVECWRVSFSFFFFSSLSQHHCRS